MKNKEEVIEFAAQVVKVQSMSDGAIRITLDMSESLTDIAAKLMECKNRGGLLEIAAVAVKAKHGRRQKQEDSGNSSATY